MNTQLLLEKIFRRILKESSEEKSDLAALVNSGDEQGSAIIYLKSKIEEALENEKDVTDSGLLGNMKAIVGYILVKKPESYSIADEPCNGAWEVNKSWGPGYGKLVYDMGYALSPSGILIPDRTRVSAKAQMGWIKASAKYKKEELSDTDCTTYKKEDEQHLNYSFDRSGELSSLQSRLKSMQNAHNDVKNKIKEAGQDPRSFEQALNAVSSSTFMSAVPMGESRSRKLRLFKSSKIHT